jgi:hypothetical protein
MKDFFLILTSVIVTIVLMGATIEHDNTAAEMASIERIELITNAITNEAVNDALMGLNDEQLTEVLGL